jgi:hypothetical protein
MIDKEIINKPLQKIKEYKEDDSHPLIWKKYEKDRKSPLKKRHTGKICVRFCLYFLLNLCSYYIMYKLYISV